jgi:hypothetical protein
LPAGAEGRRILFRWVDRSMSEKSRLAPSLAPDQRAPRIAGLAWGRLAIEGGRAFKDAKLFPGGARTWDWRETGTHHVPGIQPADVRELLDRGATTVVLSQGVLKQLQVCPQTLRFLEERGVQVHVLPTPQAVDLFNELRDREPVGGLFHTTC